MEVDFDPIKNKKNIKERQLSFERAKEVDFNTALVFPQTPERHMVKPVTLRSATWIVGCMCCVSLRPRQASG